MLPSEAAVIVRVCGNRSGDNSEAGIFMRSWIAATVVAMCFVGLSACTQDAPWNGTMQEVNGISTAVNHGIPLFEEPPFSLSEQIRIGGEDLFDDMPLNRVFSAVQNSDHEIIVSDVGNYRVVKFDSLGNHLQSFGSRGQGPNEFGAVGSIVLSEDTIYVQDTRRRTISKMNLGEGVLYDPIKVDLFGTWGVDSNGNIHMSNYHSLYSQEDPALTIYSNMGTVEGQVYSSYRPVPELNGVGGLPHLHYSDSRAYYAWPYPYRVEVLSTDMRPLFNFELSDDEFVPPTSSRVVDGMNIGGSLSTQVSQILEVENRWILVEVRYSDLSKPRRVDVFNLQGRYVAYFYLEVGEGITSYANGLLWSTVNGGMLKDMLPFVIGKRLSPSNSGLTATFQ